MRNTIKQKILVISPFAVLFFPSNLCAAVGFFGSYINISVTPGDGGSGTPPTAWYSLQGVGATNNLNAFDGFNLGTINAACGAEIQINDIEGLTFKNSGGDVTGTLLNYSIVPTGNTHAFSELGVGFTANATFTDAESDSYSGSGDQKWSGDEAVNGGRPFGGTDGRITLASGLAAGTYELQVFLKGTSNEGDFFDNNGGSNFTAGFTVIDDPSLCIPEPSSLLLLSIAGLAICRRAR